MKLDDDDFERLVDIHLAHIANMLVRKRQDYGEFGEEPNPAQHALDRVQSKVRRLVNLTASGKTPNFESINDTWMDITGYAILAMIYGDEG